MYDSPFDLHKKTATDPGDLKRPGSQVATAAERWLEQNSSAPFFLSLHLCDLHTPYDLPPYQDRRRGETGYEAELVYVDRIIGGFEEFLERQRVFKKAAMSSPPITGRASKNTVKARTAISSIRVRFTCLSFFIGR